MKKKIFVLTFFLATFFLQSCQTYTSQNSKIRNELYDGNVPQALKKLDESGLSSQDRNYALYRMEKGMLLYLNMQYNLAIPLWIQADKKLDDLYTLSISRTVSSFAINDSMSDYTAEAHERVLLPIFSSIAFFAENNLANAQVMIRRSYDVTNVLQDENQGKNTFRYDAFSHYFAGLVYEANKNWDNALVEYKLALKNISQNGNQSNTENESARNEILKAMGRLAEYRNRNDLLAEVKKYSSNLTWSKQENLLKKGEVYIIYECGKSPIKEPEEIIIPTGKTIVKISFPKYSPLPYASRYADIFVDNKHLAKTTVMENIGKMASQALSDRRVRDIAKMASRVIAKDLVARKLNDENPFAGFAADLFNIATEVADTRSWTTLPDTIQVARVSVVPNQETEIEVRPQAGESKKFSVNISPGEKKLIRLRTFN